MNEETINPNQAGIQQSDNGEVNVEDVKEIGVCPSCKHTKDKCECGTPEIWTEEKVKGKIEDILKTIREDEEIITIGEILDDYDLSMRQWAYLKDKFKDCQVITNSYDKIETILESRINTGGLRGKLKEGMTKFNLINNYDWKERSETDLTSKGESIILNISKEIMEKNVATSSSKDNSEMPQ